MTPLLLRQAASYALIGGVCLVTDFFLYAVFTRVLGIHYLLANIVAFFLTGLANFRLHWRFTFRRAGRPPKRKYTLFFLIAGTGIILNTLVLATLVARFGLHDFFAKICASVIVYFWNFGMNRHWTFRHPEAAQDIPLVPL